MDYVVAGFGIEAILALAGFALWELFGSVEESERGWLDRTAMGLMLGALVLWAVTGVTLFSAIDDSTGSFLVILTTVVILLATGIVSFWYRHIEQTLPAPHRQPKTSVTRDRKIAKSEIPTPRAVAPSEWDSWPERDERPIQAASEQPPSFEPEVAAVSESVVAAESAIPEDEIQRIEIRSLETPENDDTVPALELEEANEPVRTDSEKPVLPMATELPENVRAFRPKTNEKSEPESMELVSGRLESEFVDESLSGEFPAIESSIDDRIVEAVDRPEENEDSGAAPAAFESALLADIEIAPVEGDGRYRSPLLADLGTRTNELEEIGLAKWRPEARLTSEEDEPVKPSRKKNRS